MIDPLTQFVIYIGLAIAQSLLAPKPDIINRKRGEFTNEDFPMADESVPINYIQGTVRIKNINSLGWYNVRTEPITEKRPSGSFLGFDFNHKTHTLGHRYFLTGIWGIGQGFLEASELMIDDQRIHTIRGADGRQQLDHDAVIEVDNADDFYAEGIGLGGSRGGRIRFYTGHPNQPTDQHLREVVPNAELNVHAFRGTSYFIIENFYLGESNRVPDFSWVVTRKFNNLGLGQVGSNYRPDMNPMECIYDIMVNVLEYDPEIIDVDSFLHAGRILEQEGNGVSRNIKSLQLWQDYLGELLDQSNAIMYYDPASNKYFVNLLRADYDPNQLTVINDEDIDFVKNYQIEAEGDQYNQIRLQYTNRDDLYNPSVIDAKDDAKILEANSVISATKAYPGVSNSTLATQLAARDLRNLTEPLNRFSVVCFPLPKIKTLRPGEPVIVNWSKYAINNRVVRVDTKSLGTFEDRRIVLDVSEDRYQIAPAATEAPGGTDFEEVPVIPQTLNQNQFRIIESPGRWSFRRAEQVVEVTEVNALDADDSYLRYLLPNTNTANTAFDAEVSPEDDVYQKDKTDGLFTSCATIGQVLDEPGDGNHRLFIPDDSIVLAVEDTLEDLFPTRVFRNHQLRHGENLILINNEFIQFRQARRVLPEEGLADGYILTGLNRGQIDEVPTLIKPGDKIWFVTLRESSIGDIGLSGDPRGIRVSLRMKNAFQLLPITDDNTFDFELTRRPLRPIRPQRLRVNNVSVYDLLNINEPQDISITRNIVNLSMRYRNRERVARGRMTFDSDDFSHQLFEEQMVRVSWKIGNGAEQTQTFDTSTDNISIDLGSETGLVTMRLAMLNAENGLISHGIYEFYFNK